MTRSRFLLLLLSIAVSGCQAGQQEPVADPEGNSARSGQRDNSQNGPAEVDTRVPGQTFKNEDLDRIEHELQIKLPTTYRRFMLTRGKELIAYTFQLRGQTELWFDSEFFAFNSDRLISENIDQRSPEMAAGAAFPRWWTKYFFFGTNGGGDYYAMHLDGTPGVWFVACDAGTVRPYADSLDEYADRSLKNYDSEVKVYQRLENLYQQKVRGEIEQAEFDKQWAEIATPK